ncbi:MAG: acetylglucosamine-6-sulfatase, partial [Verrucomicrobiota bacterium]|nr:acetylglucosamine-6-sulfatase [Verrucomicrobiota bacterium]
SVVTSTHKYIYWPYGEGMDPSEELFDIEFDPYEMRNLLAVDHPHPALEKMRAYYQQWLDSWSQQAVTHNHYQVFAKVFDRHLPWAQKQSELPKAFR